MFLIKAEEEARGVDTSNSFGLTNGIKLTLGTQQNKTSGNINAISSSSSERQTRAPGEVGRNAAIFKTLGKQSNYGRALLQLLTTQWVDGTPYFYRFPEQTSR